MATITAQRVSARLATAPLLSWIALNELEHGQTAATALLRFAFGATRPRTCVAQSIGEIVDDAAQRSVTDTLADVRKIPDRLGIVRTAGGAVTKRTRLHDARTRRVTRAWRLFLYLNTARRIARRRRGDGR